MGNILVVVLIVLACTIVVNLINDKTVTGTTKISCNGSHDWFQMYDQHENYPGMICQSCGFKAGE